MAESPRLVAVLNQKGGAGKTTTAVNLAACLAELGERVLMVDLDPQASATRWLGAKPGAGLLDLFNDDADDLAGLAVETTAPGVECVPASPALVNAESAIGSEKGSDRILGLALENLSRRRWSFVLVDCPPTVNLLTRNALAGCRELVVPVETSMLSVAGVADLLQAIERVRERKNPALRIAGFLLCRYDGRTRLAHEVENLLRERFADAVFDTVIRENVRLREAWSFGQPITLYAPTSAGASDYRAAAAELIGRAP